MTASDTLQNLLSGKAVKDESVSDCLVLSHLTFQEHVSFSNCTFLECIELTGCRFGKGAEFVGCEFAKTFSMESCTVEGDLHLRACAFEGEARFERLHVNGKLEVRAPRNSATLSENSRFIARPYVSFSGFANFSQIRVSGEANFGSVQFENGVDFYNARIEGPVFFRKDYCKGFRRAQKEAADRNKKNPTGKVDPQELDKATFPDKVFPPVHFRGGRVGSGIHTSEAN